MILISLIKNSGMIHISPDWLKLFAMLIQLGNIRRISNTNAIQPGKLTWTLKVMVWEKDVPFSSLISWGVLGVDRINDPCEEGEASPEIDLDPCNFHTCYGERPMSSNEHSFNVSIIHGSYEDKLNTNMTNMIRKLLIFSFDIEKPYVCNCL